MLVRQRTLPAKNYIPSIGGAGQQHPYVAPLLVSCRSHFHDAASAGTYVSPLLPFNRVLSARVPRDRPQLLAAHHLLRCIYSRSCSCAPIRTVQLAPSLLLVGLLHARQNPALRLSRPVMRSSPPPALCIVYKNASNSQLRTCMLHYTCR